MRVQDSRESDGSQGAEGVRGDARTDGAGTDEVSARFCASAPRETQGQKEPEFADDAAPESFSLQCETSGKGGSGADSPAAPRVDPTFGETGESWEREPGADSSYKERGSRFRPGAPWERDPRYGGAPPIGAVRTHFGVLGYVDPDGPAPVHPRHCPGEGSCIYCVALQHWQSCQVLKAQRPQPSASSMNDAAAPERRPPAPATERGERKWKRKKRKALPPPSDEGGQA